MTRTRIRPLVLALVVAVTALISAPAPGVAASTDDCVPGVDGCLPTPAQCATGLYNGHWDGAYAGRQVDCLGARGHIVHYLGGDANVATMGPACEEGASIENDVLVFGVYANPNDCVPHGTEPAGPGEPGTRFEEAARGKYGAVASISPIAAAIGLEVLRGGGNAIDAAVATTFAIGVIEPGMCGIGGAGFLVYRGADGTVASLDFREAAPAAVTPTTFEVRGPRGGQGVLPPSTGHRVVAVPGMVAGMAAAMERLGTLSLSDVIAPAEHLARSGVRVSNGLANDMGRDVHRERILLFPESARTLYRHGAQPRPPGAVLEQKKYADSLRLIAEQGPSAFYEGPIADLIAADMERSRSEPVAPGDEGLLTKQDLASYEAIWREPLRGTYRDNEIITMAPPASGVFAVEMLNILEGYDLSSLEHSSAESIHLTVEAQKLAWIDRETYIADPDPPWAPVRTTELVSKDYAEGLRSQIVDAAGDPTSGGLGSDDEPPVSGAIDSPHTTHVSVVDAAGSAVALTCTMGEVLGSAVVAPGTGFFLNNGSNGFYRSGTINEPGPGKRPLSNMTPLIVVDPKGHPILVTGGAGGSMIPMGVVHTVLNVVDYGMDVARALDAARFTSPVCCAIEMEAFRIPASVRDELVAREHSLVLYREYLFRGPFLQAVGMDPRSRDFLATSDQRGFDLEGAAALSVKPKPRPSRGGGKA